MPLLVQSFYDPATFTYTHLAWDSQSQAAALIDPVLDFNPKDGLFSTGSLDQASAFIGEKNLSLQWILETHAHADHVSAARLAQSRHGGIIAIGSGIKTTQATLRETFGEAFCPDGGAGFDQLFDDGDRFMLGSIPFRVVATPGHTPTCSTYACEGHAFVGDTLFMHDYGTARCDFPGGDAAQLHESIAKILSLPDATTLWMCHDYPPGGREPKAASTVELELLHNPHIAGLDKEQFIAQRRARDKALQPPRLLMPSLLTNLRGGKLPPPQTAQAQGVDFHYPSTLSEINP